MESERRYQHEKKILTAAGCEKKKSWKKRVD